MPLKIIHSFGFAMLHFHQVATRKSFRSSQPSKRSEEVMLGRILYIFLLLCVCKNYCFVSRLYRKSYVKSFDILESFQRTTSKIECLSHCLNSQTFCQGISINYKNFPCSTLNNIIAEDDPQLITEDIWIDPRILVKSINHQILFTRVLR